MQIIFSSLGEFNDQRYIGPAEWSFFDLIFIHDGEVRIDICSDATIFIGKGQAVMFFPHTPFQGKSITERTIASVHHFSISATDSEALCWPLRLYKGKQRGYELFDSMGDIQIVHDLNRLLRSRTFSTGVAAHAMQCNLLCLSLAQLQGARSLIPASSSSRSLIALKSVLDWLSENLNRSISLSEMANRAKLSQSHFRRLFRQQYGTSPGQYHQQQRIREACRLLRESVLPVKAVSAQLGFEDLAKFYRAFKKHAGMPPAAYRRKNRPIG